VQVLFRDFALAKGAGNHYQAIHEIRSGHAYLPVGVNHCHSWRGPDLVSEHHRHVLPHRQAARPNSHRRATKSLDFKLRHYHFAPQLGGTNIDPRDFHPDEADIIGKYLTLGKALDLGKNLRH